MPLVDYRSSSEEEEEGEKASSVNLNVNNTGAGSFKRPLSSEELSKKDAPGPKRIKPTLPPLPPSLTALFKDRERPKGDPAKYQGRIRSRPHIDGSWPVHVYLEVKLSNELFDIVSTLIKSTRKIVPSTVSMLQSIQSQSSLFSGSVPIEAESAEDATELHISLTRPLYLQELHMGRFTSDIREAYKGTKRFNISFSGLQSFSNDDRTRSFLSLRVGAGFAEVNRLMSEMDVIAERYNQPPFYPDPEFHASFAWAVGGYTLNPETVEAILPVLEGELGHDLRHSSMTIKKVAWKIGQKTGSVHFVQ